MRAAMKYLMLMKRSAKTMRKTVISQKKAKKTRKKKKRRKGSMTSKRDRKP